MLIYFKTTSIDCNNLLKIIKDSCNSEQDTYVCNCFTQIE